MSNKPLVSICCTCKNAEQTIRRHLDSIAAAFSHYDNLEYIVQDGGSTDATLSIIKEYRHIFGDKIYLVSEQDRCASDGFWRALSRCSGDIICASLADEELMSDAIPWVVDKFMEDQDIDIIHGDIYQSDIDGNIQFINKSANFDLSNYLSHRLPMHFAASFFRRTAFIKAALLPFPNKYDLITDDFDIWIYLGLAANIRYYPRTIAKYAVHDEAISVRSDRFIENMAHRLSFINDLFDKKSLPKEITENKNIILSNFCNFAINLLNNANFTIEAQIYKDVLANLSATDNLSEKTQPYNLLENKRKLKTLLISLPGLNTGDEPLFPLGIGYLLASLRQDRPVQALHYQHPEHAHTQLPEVIQRYSPDIVGLTCTTFNRGIVKETCQWLRAEHPGIRIVLGGVHASFMYEHALKEYGADFVVIGEGEITFRELCRALDDQKPLLDVKGIAFIEGDRVVTTEPRETIKNLDDLPMPDYSFAGEMIRKSGMGFIITSRGCPVRCSFCSTSSYWGQKVRTNSPRRVVDEMEALVATYGVRKIFFHDDTFNLGMERVRNICAEITSRGLAVEWGVSCRVSPVSEEMIDLMVAAGCRHICWGIESGSEKMLHRIDKKITKEQISKAFSACCKYLGTLSVGAFAIVGNPGENEETIAESCQLINSLQMTDAPSTAVLYVLPGTKLYAELLAEHPEIERFWAESPGIMYYTLENSLDQLNVWAARISQSGSIVHFDRSKHFWNNVLFGNIPQPVVPNLSFIDSELNHVIPPEIRNDEFYFLIQKMAQEEQIQNVLEIGSSAGGGSTEAFVTGLSNNKNKPKLYCMEVSKPRFSELQKRYADKDFVNCYNVSSVPVSKFPSEAEVAKFYTSTPTALNAYPLDRVIGWLRQDIDYIKSADVYDNGIQCIKTETGIDTFDMVLIDGSEFTGKAELDEVYGAKLILLDDINGFKNYANRQRLLADPNYRLVHENFNVRNGYSIFRKNEFSLPIHFFTIVLNGAPFIRHHIEQFLELPFQWHWHIVEGVAELAHDTAWSLPNGGMISDELHNNGLSNDGTTAYLDQLAQSYPGKVSLYRKPAGKFWDGKLEMVSAPLANIVENCLLWQVDADELWTSQQIAAMHELFVNSPGKTAAYFHCDYFVGPRKYVSSVNTWATYPNDWVRVWRFHPGMKWAAHEPPILVDANNLDVVRINPFTRDETKDLGITFQHFAYATESQVRFKEIYYGYHDAVKHWRRLQTTTGPVNPADYLPWAKHDATVDDWPLGKGELLFDQSLAAHKPKQYISMSVDAETQFETELRKLFQKILPTSIIETGTYLGRGTSTIIWRALHDLQINADFTTIEVNPEHHRQAVEYFRANGMTIKAELGLSVPKAILPDEAKIAEQFVSNKEYDSIYYDHDEAVRAKLYYSETNYNVPDNLLYKAMEQHHFKPDFVLLDSAGHIGFLEFQYFMSLIQDDCYLMLDDVFHCKHFKTLQVIKQDPRFEIVVESNEKFGFCIAKYRHVKSLVILRTDAIGDNVLASSMIPYIKEKYRNATLTLVCQDRVAPLYKECPFIENIIDYNLWQLLNNESYRSDIADNINKLNPSLLLDTVYSRDLQNYFLALSTQTTPKIACEGDFCNILPEPKIEFDKNFTCLIPNNSNDKTELDRHRSFLRGIDIFVPKLNPVVWISQNDEDLAEEFFERMNLDSKSTIVVFPGALMPQKSYSHFNRVLHALQGYTLLVLGGTEIEEYAEELCKSFSGRAYNLAGKTTLLQLAAIMKRARLYVGLDTSGVHIACAVGLPNVVILGGGHFGRFLPYSPLTTTVCYPLECYNCSWRCKYSRCHCVCDIRPDVVINAIKHALSRNQKVPCVYVQTQSIYPDSPQSLHWSRLSNVLDLDSVEIIEG